jgi:hypothetical protein
MASCPWKFLGAGLGLRQIKASRPSPDKFADAGLGGHDRPRQLQLSRRGDVMSNLDALDRRWRNLSKMLDRLGLDAEMLAHGRLAIALRAATTELVPVMNADDLRKGLAKVAGK